MVLPEIILFVVFFALPFLSVIGMSFTNYNGIQSFDFVGLDNFRRLLGDARAMRDLQNTLLFGFVSALLLNVFGLIYALVLEKDTRLNRLARTLIYVPSIISGFISGYIWKIILTADTGALYRVLEAFGLLNLWTNYLADMDKAIWVVIVVNLIQFVGGTAIIYVAGIQSIDPELYDVAKMDGAGYFKTLRYVTMPLLTPAIRINVVTNIIGSLAVFDIIMSLTGGGPGYATESLSMFIYRNVYGGKTGYATAVSVVMILVILIPVVISMLEMNRRERKYE